MKKVKMSDPRTARVADLEPGQYNDGSPLDVIAHNSKMSDVEHGLHNLGGVILGCLMGLLVSWLTSGVWQLRAAEAQPFRQGAKA